jgi:hypothetical protein
MSFPPSPLSKKFDRSLDDSNIDLVPVERPRKPRIRPYSCDSEGTDEWDDSLGFECDGFDHYGEDSFDKLDSGDSFLDDDYVSMLPTLDDASSYPVTVWNIAAKLAPGILLTHRQDTMGSVNTESGSVTSQMTIAESALNWFTIYRELRDELDVAKTFAELQREWKTVASYVCTSRLGFSFGYE